jgi:hypothetical protein
MLGAVRKKLFGTVGGTDTAYFNMGNSGFVERALIRGP